MLPPRTGSPSRSSDPTFSTVPASDCASRRRNSKHPTACSQGRTDVQGEKNEFSIVTRALGHHRAGRHRPGFSARRRRLDAPASSSPSARAIRRRKASPSTSPARASSTAIRRCSTIREVEAIYIATPHPGHAEWAIKAAEAGKHVLVEKPMALTAFEVDAVFHAHRKAGTFAGEAFMYRLHPQTAKLGELIASGAIGEVRMIQSSFGFQMPRFMPEHRLFANDLAGGGILDVGGYPVSMARFIAGAAAGKPFLDPIKVAGAAHLGQAGTDEWSAAVLQFRERHRRAGLLRGLRPARQCAAHPRRRRAASKCRTSGSPAARAIRASARSTSSRATARARRSASTTTAAPLFLRGRRRGRGDPRRAAGVFLARHELGRQPRQRPRARPMARRRPASNTTSRSRRGARTRSRAASSRQAGRDRASARFPACRRSSRLVALGFEDFRTFSSGAILLDAFFEAGGNALRHGVRLRRGLHRKALRRLALEPRRARSSPS